MPNTTRPRRSDSRDNQRRRTRKDLLAAAAELFEVVRSGAVRIAVRQTFSLKDAAEAHRALEARATTGSTVLLP